jgi:hypothetical protein
MAEEFLPHDMGVDVKGDGKHSKPNYLHELDTYSAVTQNPLEIWLFEKWMDSNPMHVSMDLGNLFCLSCSL